MTADQRKEATQHTKEPGGRTWLSGEYLTDYQTNMITKLAYLSRLTAAAVEYFEERVKKDHTDKEAQNKLGMVQEADLLMSEGRVTRDEAIKLIEQTIPEDMTIETTMKLVKK
jgi:hypothetical protein